MANKSITHPDFDTFAAIISVNKVKTNEDYQKLRQLHTEHNLPDNIESVYPKFISFGLVKMYYNSMKKKGGAKITATINLHQSTSSPKRNEITKTKEQFISFVRDNNVITDRGWRKFKKLNFDKCLGFPRDVRRYYTDFSWNDIKPVLVKSKPQTPNMPKETFLHTTDALGINLKDVDAVNEFIFNYNKKADKKYVIPINVQQHYQL